MWWVMVGLAMITQALSFGWLGIGCFYCGHILADLGWYSFVSGAVAKGRRFITDRAYRWLLFVCGLFLIFLALTFIYDALYLKSCANQTFSKGTILDWDGTFNLEYEYEVFPLSSTLKFERVRSRNMWPDARLMIPSRDQTMLSDLNRYRTTISFELYHYEEAN